MRAATERGRGRTMSTGLTAMLAVVAALTWPGQAAGQGTAGLASPGARLEPADVFGLELATDPRVSPTGGQVVYVRTFFDVMSDRRRSNLWIVGDGVHRPLTTGNENDASPRWSPAGDRVLFASSRGDGPTQLRVRWMDATQQEAKITDLPRSPSGPSWSPDGRSIAFTMFVPEKEPGLSADLPTPPEGAEWVERPRVVDDLQYRADGAGYLPDGHSHVFVVPAEGGTPRQLTRGPYDHTGTPSWTPDGRHLIVTANRRDDAEYEGNDTELYEVSLEDGALRALTDRYGPDQGAVVSPDGEHIAYTGFDDRHQGYQVTKLYVMERDGSNRRVLADDLDRSVGSLAWSEDSRAVFGQYTTEGRIRVARFGLDGSVEELPAEVGATSYGRPYAGGSFSYDGGVVAYTHGSPDRPSEVGVVSVEDGEPRVLTDLNADLLGHKELGEVEEIWWESSHDGRPVQGWVVKPPGFDPSRTYPLVLEIHGGPFAAYGPHFATEIQLYAAAGYVVLYANPRGSTSYGQEFGNLIHHAYPGHDYEDLMSGVDAVLEEGYVDEDRLFVTGGSGGGVLTAWIVGSTDRFRAAVVAKPVINWTSFVLTADAVPFFYKYWFPDFPWEAREHYWARSPLSKVGNVTTPTMLLTGERDYRTPMAETEQFYAALKLQEVPTAMVRIQGSGHGIVSRPSNLVNKVAYILAWFERYAEEEGEMASGGG